MRHGLAAVAVAVLTACAPTIEAPSIRSGPSPVLRWDSVLSDLATDEGGFDPRPLQERQDDLERVVAWVAELRPPSLRRAVGRHAFYLIAHDAWVLYGARELGLWDELSREGVLSEEAWERLARHEVVVDGQRLPLGQLEQTIIRTRLQDHRDLAVLHRLRPDDPPWMARAPREASIDAQLHAAMTRWMMDPVRGVRIQDGVVEVPARLAAWSWDVGFQTAGLSMCAALARVTLRELRLELEAAEALGCRWRPREGEGAGARLRPGLGGPHGEP